MVSWKNSKKIIELSIKNHGVGLSAPFLIGEKMFIDKLILKIADIYLEIGRKNGTINSKNYEQKDILFRSILWNFLSSILICLISIPFGIFNDMIVIMICSNVLMNFCGTYHSVGNLTYCFIISLIQFVVLGLMSHYCQINIILLQILSLLSIVYIFKKSPIIMNIDDIPDTKEEKIMMKFDFLLMSICFFILGIVSDNNISRAIYLSIIFIVPFMNDRIIEICNKIRFLLFKK